MRAFLVLIFVALFPTMAFAHLDPLHAVGFVHGFEHPTGGLDHILAMVAVGVFAFVLGGRALWLVPLSFLAMMVVGFAMGINGVNLPFVELGIALSSVVIGGAAALKAPIPVAGAMALVGVFAVFHGHAHGAEMPESAGGLLYAAGFVAATAALHGVGIAAALGVSRLVGKHDQVIARIAGAVFALGGIGVLFGWL
jgi:urease accessory protein